METSSTTSVSTVQARRGLIPPTGSSDPRRRLGEVAIDLGFADRELIERVMAKENEAGQPMGALLVESGIIDSNQLARILAERNSLPFVDLREFEVDQGAANLVDATEARRYGAIPIAFLDDGGLLVATGDPSNVVGTDNIAMATGYDVKRAIGTADGIATLITRLTGLTGSVKEIDDAADGDSQEDGVVELRASAKQAPVVKLVHAVIADAVNRGASDIHFDPRRDAMQVRYRVDGVMLDSMTVPNSLVAGLVSRIKIMADLDIAERRIPQDGRMALDVDGRHIDIRVAVLPVIRGESVVMRILDRERVVLELSSLGMRDEDRELVLRAVGQIQGAILATGPTGTGKTTTLYALLRELNTSERTLISIEDPVEYEVDGVKQIHVNHSAGVTFASGLRSMVRSDPDALMVGEIRDTETAQIAMEAALTGHLVLSTLHTNSASITAARLIDMGVEPFLIASGIRCIIGQRLARRLCDDCKRPATISGADLSALGIAENGGPPAVFEAHGCASCLGTGYRGRIGLYEVLTPNEEIRSLIIAKAASDDIEAAAVAAGMHRMRDDGLEKARNGITSVAEVLRVVGDA
ncbi:MAG: ATPase, T2SS/T4P/T4SS family [Solirubrobacterales bacterium]